MKFLFNPESGAYKVLSKVMDLFILNILFILGALPLITAGCSTVAMYTVCQKIERDEVSSIITEFAKAYKQNLIRGVILEVVFLAAFFLMGISFSFLGVLPEITRYLSSAGLFIALVVEVLEIIYIYPYSARYENQLSNSFKVCFQVALLNRKVTLGIIFSLVGFLYLFTLNNFIFSLLSFFFLLFGFSGIAYFISKLVVPIFAQYET